MAYLEARTPHRKYEERHKLLVLSEHSFAGVLIEIVLLDGGIVIAALKAQVEGDAPVSVVHGRVHILVGDYFD